MYKDLTPKKIVGLLWADQNMRDFGDQHRLLMSSERLSLWRMLNNLSEEELDTLIDNPYFNSLCLDQAKHDNIIL